MLAQPAVTYPAYMPQPRHLGMATLEPFNGIGDYMIPEMDPAFLSGPVEDAAPYFTAATIIGSVFGGLSVGLAFWSYKRSESPLYAGLAFTGGALVGGFASTQIAKFLLKRRLAAVAAEA